MRKKVSLDMSLEEVLTYPTVWMGEHNQSEWEKHNAELIEDIKKMSKGALVDRLRGAYWRLDGALYLADELSTAITLFMEETIPAVALNAQEHGRLHAILEHATAIRELGQRDLRLAVGRRWAPTPGKQKRRKAGESS